MTKDKKQILQKRIKTIPKEIYFIGLCLFAIILIYTVYLNQYRVSYLSDYLFAVVKYVIAGIPLGYALYTFIPASNEPSSRACTDIWRMPRGSDIPQLAVGYLTGGKGQRGRALIGLFTAFFILTLAELKKASDYWNFISFFWPLLVTTCFSAVMTGKLKSRKRHVLSILPLFLFIVIIGSYAVWTGMFNLLIIPFWLVQFSCAAIYLTLAAGDIDKVRIRTQRLLIVFCLLQTWVIYEELLYGYGVIDLFRQIFILLWPAAVLGFFNLSERVKGIGRLFICFAMVFLGMWMLAEPYITDTGLGWEAVGALYLLCTADVVIIMESRRHRKNSKKAIEYGAIALINAGYLTFFVWSSYRIRNILYSFGMRFVKGKFVFQEINWGSFRIEALKANLTGSLTGKLDAVTEAMIYMLSLSEMNSNVGVWIPLLIVVLTCCMLYLAIRLHCGNETAEIIKNYLCYGFLVRIVFSFLANLFLIISSRVKFPLLIDGEADFAVIVMLLFLLFYRKEIPCMTMEEL